MCFIESTWENGNLALVCYQTYTHTHKNSHISSVLVLILFVVTRTHDSHTSLSFPPLWLSQIEEVQAF